MANIMFAAKAHTLIVSGLAVEGYSVHTAVQNPRNARMTLRQIGFVYRSGRSQQGRWNAACSHAEEDLQGGFRSRSAAGLWLLEQDTNQFAPAPEIAPAITAEIIPEITPAAEVA
jgi:hypothetical protein